MAYCSTQLCRGEEAGQRAVIAGDHEGSRAAEEVTTFISYALLQSEKPQLLQHQPLFLTAPASAADPQPITLRLASYLFYHPASIQVELPLTPAPGEKLV